MSLRLPQDKHDLAAVGAIETASAEAAPLLPALLEWTQDANWPVARALAPVLPRFGASLCAPLAAVLRSDDADWKWHVLTLLGPHLSTQQLDAIRPELERLAERPNAEEREAGADEAALELLDAHRAG